MSRLRTHDGHNLGTLCVIDQKPREVSDVEVGHLQDLATLVMDQMELRLTARTAVAQREMLLHELHHRVKNNLQILLSVVSSAERQAQMSETINFVRAMRGRLFALGSAHEAMRDVGSLGAARTGQLLEDLATAIGSALGEEAVISTQVEDHEVKHETLLPLVLILNELLTNAIKYGRDGNAKITVTFRLNDGSFELMVRDPGPGFPEEVAAGSSGLSFVRALVGQLNGNFVIRYDAGACCVVTFPA